MKKLLLATTIAACASIAGCGDDYDHTDIPPNAIVSSFSGASDNPADTINVHHINITEGHLVKAHIVVYDDDNKPMSLVVKSVDTGVIDVRYVISPDDFAFFAESVGSTSIQLIADDTLVLTINADVVAQPAP